MEVQNKPLRTALEVSEAVDLKDCNWKGEEIHVLRQRTDVSEETVRIV